MNSYLYGQSIFLPPFPFVSLDRRVTIELVNTFHGLVAVGTSSDRVVGQPRLY